jgi:hypothetical protein
MCGPLSSYFGIQILLILLAWSDDYSDDEDDTAELLAELERIKKERAEDKLRKVVPKPFFC